jgi:hypothetical protein
MDLKAYRQMQDSGWVREQRDLMALGESRRCPVVGCGGTLEPFDVDELRDPADESIPAPGGVRCTACGARSRPVTL